MVSFKCVSLLRPSYMNGTARRGMFALLNSYGVSINLERDLVFPFSSFLFWLCIYLLLQMWTYQWRVLSINFFLSFLVLTQNGHIKSYSQFEFNKIIFNRAHSHAEWLHNYLTTDRPSHNDSKNTKPCFLLHFFHTHHLLNLYVVTAAFIGYIISSKKLNTKKLRN